MSGLISGGGLGGILGGFSQAFGQFQQSEAQSAASQASAAAFAANAAISQQNAASALVAGQAAKKRQVRIGQARLGSAATKFLKGGVVLAGSPLAVLGDQAVNEALAAEDLAFEGEAKATQFRNQARLQGFFSEQASAKADKISSQGIVRAGSTLLGSLGKVF